MSQDIAKNANRIADYLYEEKEKQEKLEQFRDIYIFLSYSHTHILIIFIYICCK